MALFIWCHLFYGSMLSGEGEKIFYYLGSALRFFVYNVQIILDVGGGIILDNQFVKKPMMLVSGLLIS
jgi:hypothetical protein